MRRPAQCVFSLLLVVLAARADQVRRIAVTPERIAGTLTDSGWKIGAEQIKLLSEVATTGPDTRLQVVKVARGLNDALTVKLRCHDRRACLPFYVLIENAGTAGRSGQISVAGAEQAASQTAIAKPLFRSGDAATMMFANRSVRITMPVICLQNGLRGQTIRVTSTDRRRFYKAEVVGPGLLKAATL